MPLTSPETPPKTAGEHSSDQRFIDYYARESLSKATLDRFARLRDNLLRLPATTLHRDDPDGKLHVADIGCGTGTQSRLWAELGHKAYGLDINAALIEIAKARAGKNGMTIQFDVGSATKLPYPDASMNVALLPELLEHVADWHSCIDEAIRIVKVGGLVYLSTTNWLCPIQQEFTLPLYSWYPGFLKRHFERLAVTTRAEIVNYCKYPAVNWFSFYSLSAYMKKRGFRCLDRFDMVNTDNLGAVGKLIITLIRALPPLRFVGQVLTTGTIVFAIKN